MAACSALITLAVVNAGLLGSWKNFTIKTSLAYELPQMKNAILPWRAFMVTQERCLFWECGDRLQHCLIVCKEVAAGLANEHSVAQRMLRR